MDVGLTKRWQRAGKICVFDRDVVEICQGIGMVDVESCRLAGMTDGVLAGDYASVREAGGYVMREIADNGGQHGGFRLVDASHDCEEIDCGFDGAGEQSGSGEEQVSYRCGLEVEGRDGGSVALEDLEVKMREDGTDEHCLRCWYRMVER